MLSYQSVGVAGVTSVNKIPEYAREYKKEYIFIRGINKELESFVYIDDPGKFSSPKADRFKRRFNRFVKAQEDGRLKKDISHLRLKDTDVNFVNILMTELEDYFGYFYDFDEPYTPLENINENDKIKYDEFYNSFGKFKDQLKPNYPTFFELYNKFLNIDGYVSDSDSE